MHRGILCQNLKFDIIERKTFDSPVCLAHCKKFQKEQINLLTIIASGRAQTRAVMDEYWALPYITWTLNILGHQLRFLLFRQRKKSVAVQ